MYVAFYAPMKPPDHPVPSGDRRMARLLMDALALAGHQVELAARLRSRDGLGNARRQARLKDLGAALARRLVRRYLARPAQQRPAAWLTYHLYYKAPDWIGPAVCDALDIPYLLAEASVAAKRAGGPWDPGHRATLAALGRAAAVIAFNPDDVECLPDPARVRPLKPFLEPAPYRAAAGQRVRHRREFAERLRLDPAQPWLLTVAMMRAGDKLSSYQALARALGGSGLRDLPWQIVVVGDGPESGQVRDLFARGAPCRSRFPGQMDPVDLPGLYAACDLFVWPAVNEAYGLALLEAQAAGLPVVAGRTGGVPAIVRNGETGLLIEPLNIPELRTAIVQLITDPERRYGMSARALEIVERDHGLAAAARRLDEILGEAVRRA